MWLHRHDYLWSQQQQQQQWQQKTDLPAYSKCTTNNMSAGPGLKACKEMLNCPRHRPQCWASTLGKWMLFFGCCNFYVVIFFFFNELYSGCNESAADESLTVDSYSRAFALRSPYYIQSSEKNIYRKVFNFPHLKWECVLVSLMVYCNAGSEMSWARNSTTTR